MQINTIECKIQKYTFVFNDEGEIVSQVPLEGEFDIFEETYISADEGKALFRISTNERIEGQVLLGSSDFVENYREIDLVNLNNSEGSGD